MELKELLNKATPRPWVVGCSKDLSHWPVFRLRDMVDPTSPQEEIADAELIQHAVNNFEELLNALKAARIHLEYCGYGDKWEREGAVAEELPDQINTAIRRAEEVSP